MRTRRGNLLTFALVFLLFGSFAIACGGVDPGGADMAHQTSGDGGVASGDMMGSGAGMVGDPCTQSSDCESGLCTKTSYDRKPGPICTYMCDPSNPNPKCTMGCNAKGYCRVP